MADFLLECKCGQMRMYQKYIKGTPNVKHWFIVCKNCGGFVETKKKERAIELWNSWDFFHESKIHTHSEKERIDGKIL